MGRRIVRLAFFLVVSIAFLSFASRVNAAVTLLHEFAGGPSDGATPYYGSLAGSGTKLYGITYAGGSAGLGTIFSMNTDGSGYSILHNFAGGGSDGATPESTLVLSGTKLYGTTFVGGDSSLGTIFSMNTDGTGFTLLHEFAGGASDGSKPAIGGLTLSGSVLYGTTSLGGDSNKGTIFSMNTDGTGFTLLREFAGGASDGSDASISTLSLDSGVLYGTTAQGGDSNKGTIFSMNTDGTGFTLLHEFAGGASDSDSPKSMILRDGVIYGASFSGGDSNFGTVYKINTDGTGFTLLHEFAGGGSDGKWPFIGPVISSGVLYGTSVQGGDTNAGVLYQINTDGTGFTLLHEFAGGTADGSSPYSHPFWMSYNLYGIASAGGDTGNGVVYSYALPVPTPVPTLPPLSAAGPSVCSAQAPSSAPHLLKADAFNNSVKLYFVPAGEPVDRYYLAYGLTENNPIYGFEYYQADNTGALSLTIKALKSNTNYYFRIRGGNGCMPGAWSNILRVKTGFGGSQSATTFVASPTPTAASINVNPTSPIPTAMPVLDDNQSTDSGTLGFWGNLCRNLKLFFSSIWQFFVGFFKRY
ncbi:MAG: hypothetical protein HYV90_01010 [Candidatus Woesebacteria bacterium]|nr:MAG: hypothetical protein HYV90_01010 [Candidatus Woesebacteria bacterium]